MHVRRDSRVSSLRSCMIHSQTYLLLEVRVIKKKTHRERHRINTDGQWGIYARKHDAGIIDFRKFFSVRGGIWAISYL